MASKLQNLIIQFQKALERLEDALQQEKNEFMRDSAIQRFEFTFELAWKTLRAFLKEEGISCESPRSCIKEAVHQELIKYEDVWLEILRMRNETTHTYDEETAEKIYSSLKEFVPRFQKLLANIKDKSK